MFDVAAQYFLVYPVDAILLSVHMCMFQSVLKQQACNLLSIQAVRTYQNMGIVVC